MNFLCWKYCSNEQLQNSSPKNQHLSYAETGPGIVNYVHLINLFHIIRLFHNIEEYAACGEHLDNVVYQYTVSGNFPKCRHNELKLLPFMRLYCCQL